MKRTEEWERAIENAVAYVEDHLDGTVDYEEAARRAYASCWHFQRVFGMLCGVTLGEYIRRRRLTLAGIELAQKRYKVTDVALRYGYETPESFSRAFARFHGIKPSQVTAQSRLRHFPRLSVKNMADGASDVRCEIRELPAKTLVGYKKRFTGVPYGEERVRQEQAFATSTRFKQWLLLGASCDYSTDYCVVTNVDDDGYDFYIAYELDEPTRQDLFDPAVTGVDFVPALGLTTLCLPARKYAVFYTQKKKRPIADYEDIRAKIVTKSFPSAEYALAAAPELILLHWRPQGEWEKERYIEICLPVQECGR